MTFPSKQLEVQSLNLYKKDIDFSNSINTTRCFPMHFFHCIVFGNNYLFRSCSPADVAESVTDHGKLPPHSSQTLHT